MLGLYRKDSLANNLYIHVAYLHHANLFLVWKDFYTNIKPSQGGTGFKINNGLYLKKKKNHYTLYVEFIFEKWLMDVKCDRHPLYSTPAHRLSLIEPGPVHTEFEAKMIEDVKKKEYPGTDPDTLHYFKNVYLPSSVDIFETLGQRPDDIARVSWHF